MKLCRFAMMVAAVIAMLSASNRAYADQISFEIENTAPTGGFFFTPVFLGFHDGAFDVFNAGGNSSAELEALAEGGNTAPLAAALLAAQGTARAETLVGNSFGPPPFDPGESIAAVFDLDTTNQRFFNYASMVIPSNDAFFGNDNAIELFDAAGNFLGTRTFDITAGMIWDGGTEVNDVNGGAAFSANGGTSTDESNPIALIDLNDLNNFVGSQTASGANITESFNANTVVARFTITAVPEPGSMTMLGIFGLVAFTKRRRRK